MFEQTFKNIDDKLWKDAGWVSIRRKEQERGYSTTTSELDEVIDLTGFRRTTIDDTRSRS